MKQKVHSKSVRKLKAIASDKHLPALVSGEQQGILPNDGLAKVYTDAEKRDLLNFATISPSHNAAIVIEELQSNVVERRSGEVDFRADFNAISSHIGEAVDSINRGRLDFPEEMLVSQSLALQAMFTSLTIRAKESDRFPHYQAYMTLALKAQSQSRSTIQALVDLKFPRQVAFVKQANISNGPQQVNNGTPDAAPSHARDFEGQPTKLNNLPELVHEQSLDTRAASTAVTVNSQLEAVGTLYGAAKRVRQGEGKQERVQGRGTRKTTRSS